MAKQPPKPRGGKRPGAGRPVGAVSQAKKTLAERARGYTDIALKALSDIAGDINAPQSARVAACNALLDRGYGKPLQAMDLSSSDGSMSFPTIVRIVAETEAAPDSPADEEPDEGSDD